MGLIQNFDYSKRGTGAHKDAERTLVKPDS